MHLSVPARFYLPRRQAGWDIPTHVGVYRDRCRRLRGPRMWGPARPASRCICRRGASLRVATVRLKRQVFQPRPYQAADRRLQSTIRHSPRSGGMGSSAEATIVRKPWRSAPLRTGAIWGRTGTGRPSGILTSLLRLPRLPNTFKFLSLRSDAMCIMQIAQFNSNERRGLVDSGRLGRAEGCWLILIATTQ